MKKVLFCMSFILIFPFIFSVSVLAAPSKEGGAKLQQDIYNNFQLSVPDATIDTMITYLEANFGDDYFTMCISDSVTLPSNAITIIGGTNYSTSNNYSQVTYNSPWKSVSWSQRDNYVATNFNGTMTINYNAFPKFLIGSWNQYKDSTDYSTNNYDPTMPAPYFYFYYEDNFDTYPLTYTQFNNNDYYIAVNVLFQTPETLYAYKDGKIVIAQREKSSKYSLVSKSDRMKNTDSSFASSMAQAESIWNNYIANKTYNFEAENEYFATLSGFAYLQDQYNDNCRPVMTLYGNQVQYEAYYFRIEDGLIYRGPSFTWSSKTQETFQLDLPSWFVPGNPAVGTQVNTNNGDDPIDFPAIGNNTGQNISITVNPNNVPNYPDYPTVVTYNHDNIFLQFIETARQLPEFFGETISLFSGMFGFIPEWIWAIIGFGFMANIVIMIVKVL